MSGELPPVDAPSAEVFVGALLASDLVDSTRLIARLGDSKAAELFARHDEIARDLLARVGGRELNRTDGFLLIFARAIDAVTYATEYLERLRVLEHEVSVALGARLGIHFGEVILREVPASQAAAGIRALQPEGLSVSVVSRVMGLGTRGQILMTRIAFDLARRSVVGTETSLATLKWMSHGPYVFKGVDEALEVFEVGVEGVSPLAPPADSEKARRQVAPGDEATLGWRPVSGAEIPHRENWILDEKLGEGGFGEVWLATNRKTRLKRVFKFCFQADRLRGLKREVVLFRLLSDALGDRDDIAHILDYQFEEAPYFLESDYSVSGSLATWIETQGGLAAIPLATRLDIVAQVAVALGAAHSAGILHKDVKPSNVLVRTARTEKVQVQLADFGIGLVTDPEMLNNPAITDDVLPGSTLSYNDSSRTGTRIYMAPELHEGKSATTKSDIFSLGVLLYQMVIGDFTRTLATG